VDWGTLKPINPYKKWITSVMDTDELLYVPCAGTAPAAIGLLQEYGEKANYLCVDSKPEARVAFETRKELQVDYQTTL
jgi:hypothetical protein